MIRSLKFYILSFSFALCALHLALSCFAQDKPTSTELTIKAWEVHGKNDVENTFKVTQECIDLYKDEAQKQQATLKEIPKGNEIANYIILNDLATCFFIQGESYMRQGKNDEAVEVFQMIIKKYPFAQAWDPRGWFWVIAKAAQDSIDKIEGRGISKEEEEEIKPKVSQRPSTITLFDPGTEDVVDYSKYGKFRNIGTKDYIYKVEDQSGLSKAVGEGIYPNSSSFRKDPCFKVVKKEKRLQGSHWDFLYSPDLEAAFFKWITAPESNATKLFYTAGILEKSGKILHALKAYYAIVVHFPGAFGWTYWHTPWYIGQAAIAKIDFILRNHPEVKWELEGTSIRIINGFDNDVSNDVVITNPGRWATYKVQSEKRKAQRAKRKEQSAKSKAQSKEIGKIIGDGKVHLVQYKNRHWQLIVEGLPYVIRGITYAPTKTGQSPDDKTLGNWMLEDFNNNGKTDGPYDAFVDRNKNNLQDSDELNIGDFQLMKEMGVNTIRLYHQPLEINKQLLRDLYETYGIRVILGDFLGKYAIGSQASWYEGTDYRNPEHQKNMLASVASMIEEFKDEPYVLFWLLGNENVYGVACNADKDPEGFFQFANKVAQYIKSLDPEHPVAICSGDVLYLDVFAKYCPDIDIFGTNAYRGNWGFGYLWQQVKEETGKPVFITEFGCPAYARAKTLEEAERLQADYHRHAWQDIEYNMADGLGAGNAIGGVVFEWLDEWWKAYEPAFHDSKPLWQGPFPDGYMHEEWLGLCSQGDGTQSPFLREPRKSYYMYQQMWVRKEER